MYKVSETFNALLKEQIKAGTILIIEENRLAIIATEDNVVQCSGVENSWFSSHETKLSQYSQYRKPDPGPFKLRNDYAHGDGPKPKGDALKALAWMHSFIDNETNLMRDYVIVNGVLSRSSG